MIYENKMQRLVMPFKSKCLENWTKSGKVEAVVVQVHSGVTVMGWLLVQCSFD